MDIILYSYCEHSKKGLEIKLHNVLFFLDKAIINDKNIKYIFIVNGDLKNATIKDKLNEVEQANSNFSIYFRENKGWDFGSYYDTLTNKVDSIDKYNFFFFVNDSVRGPFIPFWNNNPVWTTYFKDLFDADVKLVGPTLNYYRGSPHINSEMFVLDKVGLNLCMQNNIFSDFNHITEQNYIVRNCEIKMSTIVLNNNYNIKCLCEAYKNVDFRICRGEKYRDSYLNANISHNGDPLFTNKYYGGNINIYEVIFIKANRGIDDALIDRYLKWSK